jgi:hypothetical protein
MGWDDWSQEEQDHYLLEVAIGSSLHAPATTRAVNAEGGSPSESSSRVTATPL